MTSVTVVTIFEVSGESMDQVLKLQDDCEDFVASQPGFIYSKFLRSQSGTDKYSIVSISGWASKDSFDTAFSQAKLAELAEGHPKFVFHRGFYDVVRDI